MNPQVLSGLDLSTVRHQSPARAVVILIVDLEFQYRADTGEAVEHRGNECGVAELGASLCFARSPGSKRVPFFRRSQEPHSDL